jgi:hypothetical protein
LSLCYMVLSSFFNQHHATLEINYSGYDHTETPPTLCGF